MSTTYLPGVHQRGKYLRYDTALILKRFFLIEQTIIVGQAGWLPGLSDFEAKLSLPKILWEDAMTAHALRERVFELRFPSRILEVGEDRSLVEFIQFSYNAPSGIAFLMGLSRIFKPALKQAYESYLQLADVIGDGPTYRFMRLAIQEKDEQISTIERIILTQQSQEEIISEAEVWVAELHAKLQELGGIGLDKQRNDLNYPDLHEFVPSETPIRDQRFKNVRFYWPDIVDSTYPYGDGIQLQLRSAVSHFNEVWAVENGGFVLFAFSGQLGWEFIYDAARWVYDESRHCRMGYQRLMDWGFKHDELPLGTYIYDSCKGQDPIYRLGMLFYFESKNIGKKIDRIKSFEQMNDRVSQHDMDFDWADETIHTSYGKTWLSKLLELRSMDPDEYTSVKEVCDVTVKQTINTVTNEEILEIKDIATNLIQKASRICQ